ncbi:MAG: 2,4-dienoyl-CoA reductase [Lachnospiraceae bacterium]|jgi:2-enoate reductase|nr:2,4-dienoyl-CoA reductase [Lachnospiraceae bacterium]
MLSQIDCSINSRVVKYEDGKAYIETTTYNESNIRGRAFTQNLPGIRKTVQPVEADTVIVSVGYESDKELYEAVKADNVHLLGDADSPANLLRCIWSAYILCLTI